LDWERIFILGEIFPGTTVIKVKVKFTLVQAMKAENERRGTALVPIV